MGSCRAARAIRPAHAHRPRTASAVSLVLPARGDISARRGFRLGPAGV